VPHAKTCQWLGLSESWFYKWLARTGHLDGLHTDTDRRRAEVDVAVAAAFQAARGLHGSPRLHADLREAGWVLSEKTVAESMRRQGLVARTIRRRNGLTRQDKTAPKFPDLVKRDFTADSPNSKWVGDMTEIPTAAGKLYLATVIDLFSRKLLGAASEHSVSVDLERQMVTSSAGHEFHFTMDHFRRECLLGGLDEIAVTLLHEPDIRTYELRTGI